MRNETKPARNIRHRKGATEASRRIERENLETQLETQLRRYARERLVAELDSYLRSVSYRCPDVSGCTIAIHTLR